MKRSHIIAFLLLFTTGMHTASATSSQPKVAKSSFSLPPADIWINVFVHGIMSIRPHLNMSNFVRFTTDDIENTVYSKSVRILREDSFFYKNQAMQGFGLKKVNFDGPKVGNPSRAMATVFDAMWLHSQPYSYGNNYYYTYGWSGLLSPKARYRDAQDFYLSLQKEVKRIEKTHNQTPKIRILGYSHGGNVVLNLAEVRKKLLPEKPILISEFYMFGVPIQHDTDYFINDKTFDGVYHFYSTGDRIQKLDFFSLNRFFSGRKFVARKNFKLPKKLHQIQVRVMRNAKSSKPKKKYSKMPYSARRLQLLRNSSPGHIELWFFGWTPINYRESFPLNPLPAAAFSSFMIEHLKTVNKHISPERTTLIELRTDRELMLIKDLEKNRVLKVVQMPAKKEIERLKNLAEQYRPENYTFEEHEYRVALAKKNGLQEYKDEKQRNKLGHNEYTRYPFDSLVPLKEKDERIFISTDETTVYNIRNKKKAHSKSEKKKRKKAKKRAQKKQKKRKKKNIPIKW